MLNTALSTTASERGWYRPSARPAGVDLYLDRNEGPGLAPEQWNNVLRELAPDLARRYPEKESLESLLADQQDILPSQVLVTAGGDEAIDRVCRAILAPSRQCIVPVPTFEMIERYVALTGAQLRCFDWEDELPIAQMLAAVSSATGLIALVSPNNPTGNVIAKEELQQLSGAAARVGATVLLDLAYTEFADVDLTREALGLPNVVVIRTFSKAWGLAGLRVGYAMGPCGLIDLLRAAGGPFPVSGLSIAIAAHVLQSGRGQMLGRVAQIRKQRDELSDVLRELGAQALPSQANFVYSRMGDPKIVRNELLQRGIAVRCFDGSGSGKGALRITCPGNENEFERLREALRHIARSHREAIACSTRESMK